MQYVHMLVALINNYELLIHYFIYLMRDMKRLYHVIIRAVNENL